ncbi:MAG: amidohydrolase family protein [Oscillospiraceae bacterium]|jgi:predicted TIM-barrel fold metal-dependent hydrolase|nr:amidohydrolase family protein [Oscillospiraceae bacterium]
MLNYTVIDAHCHVYPEKIANKAAENIGVFYGYPVPSFDGTPGTFETMLNAGRKLGFAGYNISGAATVPSQVVSVNDGLIGTLNSFDGAEMLFAFGTAHPGFENVGGELERIKKAGLRGIKLHADCQRFNIDDRSAYPMYDAAQELNLPVLCHVGDENFDYSSPYRLLNLLKDFPRLRVIAAHLGGYREWDEGIKLAGTSNIWFDTCSAQSILPPERVVSQIRTLGAERCFFGTDYPLWNADKELNNFLNLALTDKEKEQILGQNFLSFING